MWTGHASLLKKGLVGYPGCKQMRYTALFAHTSIPLLTGSKVRTRRMVMARH